MRRYKRHMKRILVDGDIVVYRCGYASQKTRYDIYHWDDTCPRVETTNTSDSDVNPYDRVPRDGRVPLMACDNAKEANAWLEEAHASATNGTDVMPYIRLSRIEVDPVEHCLHSVKRVMQAIQDKYPEGQMEVYFSCSTADNWRTVFYPEYKANRKDARRPVHYPSIHGYMEAMYPCTRGVNTEADDIIAMRASMLDDYVVVTIDKDMDQIPGLHYNWVKEEEYVMSELAAQRSVCLQAIHGDRTDNIPGLAKWGPAAAQAWVESCPLETTEEIILAAYCQEYRVEEAEYNARLNTALVSLPRNSREIRDWTGEVESARKEMQEAADSSEGSLAATEEEGRTGSVLPEAQRDGGA